MDGMWRSLRLGRRGLGLYRDARSKCSECFSATPAMADIPTSTIRKDAHETIGDNANTDKNPIPYKSDSRLYKF